MKRFFCAFGVAAVLAMTAGCAKKSQPAPHHAQPAQPPAFHVDPATAGSIAGTIRYTGKRPPQRAIDMSSEPACVKAHRGKAYDESLMVSPGGGLANAFIYIKSGLEGKRFDASALPVTIDQSGCWFHPRVLGIQAGQPFEVVNSDPVTHNIHPMAQINREWNHSQGAGDPPLQRRFLKPEIMVPVKCNIHSWMHAYIGVVDNPYYAVSDRNGAFSIGNLPPGTYTVGVWQESLGTQEQQVTVTPQAKTQLNIVFKGK
jgi:plastocyanin